jgi:hypothetical protein
MTDNVLDSSRLYTFYFYKQVVSTYKGPLHINNYNSNTCVSNSIIQYTVYTILCHFNWIYTFHRNNIRNLPVTCHIGNPANHDTLFGILMILDETLTRMFYDRNAWKVPLI